MADDSRIEFEPFFIDGADGRLFTLRYHAAVGSRSHAVLFVPAFAEEMNKSRRQTALAARAFATAGITSFVFDLHGTGDSDGVFGEASVERWRENLARVLKHIQSQSFAAISVVALRGGALLLTDFLQNHDFVPTHTVLWQPVANGKTMISQFLRLKAAASLVSGSKGESVRDLRAQVAQGDTVEVAGYALAPALINPFDELVLRDLPACGALHWVNVGQNNAAMSPMVQGVLDQFAARELDCRYHNVAGEPFWSTVEIALAPAAIDATVAILSA